MMCRSINLLARPYSTLDRSVNRSLSHEQIIYDSVQLIQYRIFISYTSQ